MAHEVFFQTAANAFYTAQQSAALNDAVTKVSQRVDTADTKIATLETSSASSSGFCAVVSIPSIPSFLSLKASLLLFGHCTT